MPKLSVTCANTVYYCLSNDAQTEGKVKVSVTPKS